MWTDQILSMLIRPKVVHRLPGRLRIHLPILRRVAGQNAALCNALARLLCVPDGIEEATASVATGNVLIRYDADRLSEADIMRFLNGLTQLCIHNRERLQGVSPERLAEHLPDLEDLIRGALRKQLTVDAKVDIPEHVLA